MNVTKISVANFMGKIIDSHAHVGTHDGSIYKKKQLDVFVRSKLPNNDVVEKMIVSDLDVLHGLNNELEGNRAVLKIFKNNDRYALLASCNPKQGNVNNIKKLFKENPQDFVGLKFHPDIQQLKLSDRKYESYMRFATKNNLPCLFHSQVELIEGGKINPNLKHISDPENIYALAKKYPKTPVVMAHMGAGWNQAHDKAIEILVEAIRKGDANLYADVSWVDIDNSHTHIVKAIKRLKGIGEKDWTYGDQSYRLMFGTDSPLSRFKTDEAKRIYSDYVDAIKASIRNDEELKLEAEKIIEDLFYNNAKELYLTPRKRVSCLNTKMLACVGLLTGIGVLGVALSTRGAIKKSSSQELI